VVAKSDGRVARDPGPLSEELRTVFGRNCRTARANRGLSQQEVAALSGIAQANIAKIENGQNNVTLETIMRIVRVVDRGLARRLKGDLNARFGENIRDARATAGLSQAELSRRTGVQKHYISRIESGTANVTLEMVATLAMAVGEDPNWLLDGAIGERED
jgi:transcriptional regulator with XRE-family HTH domain